MTDTQRKWRDRGLIGVAMIAVVGVFGTAFGQWLVSVPRDVDALRESEAVRDIEDEHRDMRLDALEDSVRYLHDGQTEIKGGIVRIETLLKMKASP